MKIFPKVRAGRGEGGVIWANMSKRKGVYLGFLSQMSVVVEKHDFGILSEDHKKASQQPIYFNIWPDILFLGPTVDF